MSAPAGGDGFSGALRELEARLFDGPLPAAVLRGSSDPSVGPVPHPVFRPQRRHSLVVTWHAGVRQRDPREVDTDDFFTVLPPRLAPFLRRVRFHGSAAECLEALLRDLLEDVAAADGLGSDFLQLRGIYNRYLELYVSQMTPAGAYSPRERWIVFANFHADRPPRYRRTIRHMLDVAAGVAADFGMAFDGGLRQAGHPSRLRKHIPMR